MKRYSAEEIKSSVLWMLLKGLECLGSLGYSAFKQPSVVFPTWLLVPVDLIVLYFEYAEV